MPTQNLSTNEDTPAGRQPGGERHRPRAPADLLECLTTPPLLGPRTLTGSVPNLTFTPASNFNGATSFTYQGRRPLRQGHQRHRQHHVNPVNDAPSAVRDSSLASRRGPPATTALAGTDIDGDAPSPTASPSPRAPRAPSPTTRPTRTNCTYTPNANASSADSVTFSVSDGHGGTDNGVITVSIAGVNGIPVIPDVDVTTDEDTAATVTLAGTDTDGSTIRIPPRPACPARQPDRLAAQPHLHAGGSTSTAPTRSPSPATTATAASSPPP